MLSVTYFEETKKILICANLDGKYRHTLTTALQDTGPNFYESALKWWLKQRKENKKEKEAYKKHKGYAHVDESF